MDMHSPEEVLAQYCFNEIDGWDVITWAAAQDPESVYDSNALNDLLSLDDFQYKQPSDAVIDAIRRLVPSTSSKSTGELVIEIAVNLLAQGKIASGDFMDFFLNFYWNEIDEGRSVCSDWIHKVFNENNGYGFENMRTESPENLSRYLRSEMDSGSSL